MLCFYGEDSDDTDIQFEDNLEHFELIERALKENAAEVQRILANVPIVWDGHRWKKPADCYIPSDFLDRSDPAVQAVLGQMDVSWVSEDYRGNVPAEVFEKIGCNVGIKDVFVDHYAYNNHLRKADASFFEMLQKRVLYKRCQRVDYPETWDMYHSIDHLQDILCSNSVEMSVKVVDLINEKVKKHPLYGK